MWYVIVGTKMQMKIWNFKFEVLRSKTSNIEFHSSKLQIWSFKISFWREIFFYIWSYIISFGDALSEGTDVSKPIYAIRLGSFSKFSRLNIIFAF